MWNTNRSQFMAGHDCEWKRLLGYHAWGAGLRRNLQIAPLATGIAIHNALETVMRAWKDPQHYSNAPNLDYPALIGPAVDHFREIVTAQGLENADSEEAHYQVALAEALPLAYARVCEQWFKDEFNILAVEQEMPLTVDPGPLVWQTRSDFITYGKTTATYAAHDFKSMAMWYDDNVDQWRDNLQQMVNAYAAGKKLGIPVTHYYIHALVKGHKRSPSPLVKPWYQPANPPFQAEDIVFEYYYTDAAGKRRKVSSTYERTGIWKITDNPAKFVLERIPRSVLEKSIVVIGPFGVDNRKVERFLNGLPRYEMHWHNRLNTLLDNWNGFPWTNWSNPALQQELDETFARTYQCFKFGGQKCEFYNICHQKPGWDNPIENGEFMLNTPHHKSEEEE